MQKLADAEVKELAVPPTLMSYMQACATYVKSRLVMCQIVQLQFLHIAHA
jgi:hypothetical protein